MKKISFLAVFILIFSLCTFSSFAVSPDISKETEIIYTKEYGNVQIETILVVESSSLRSSTVPAYKIKTYSVDSEQIATVTLSATFGYDGKTAWVERTDSSYSVTGGWSYKNESITTSGGTANLTAKLTKLLTSSIPVEISMTCTPSGTIS